MRQIVKLSGGRLGVQSKVNEGSTFWVELREYSDSGDGNDRTLTIVLVDSTWCGRKGRAWSAVCADA